MKCNHCKEDIDLVWCLESRGRAYCSEACFTNRKGEPNTGTSTSAHDEPSTFTKAVPAGCVHVEVQQGH